MELATVLLGAHSLKNVKNTIPVGIESCKNPPTFDEKTKVDDIMLIKVFIIYQVSSFSKESYLIHANHYLENVFLENKKQLYLEFIEWLLVIFS